MTPIGGHRDILDNGFQPSEHRVTMASVSTSKNSLTAKMIVFLLILQLFSISVGENTTDNSTSLVGEKNEFNSQSLSELDLDFGYDIAGEYIDFADINQGQIRYESELDSYSNQVLQDSASGTAITSDITISNQEEINACWVNQEGSIQYYWTNVEGDTKLIEVDEILGLSDGVSTFDCAISVKQNGRASMLYTNGTDLKAGQIAYASSLYSNGDQWHTRTILEDVNVTNVELAITPEHFEWGVFRDDNGALYRVNYTGAFWVTGLIDAGPVGEDFELEINSAGDVYLMYTKANQAILLTISNGQHSEQIIVESEKLHHDIGLTLDDFDLVQLFTSILDENQTTISIERSLANENNQLSSSPKISILSDLSDTTSSVVLFADFNGDNFDDLAYSEADGNTQMLTANGRVSVHYGSQDGLSPSANLTWEGVVDSQMLGNGLAAGDYNGDGFDDLAIGSPGASTNDGLVQFTFGSSSGLSTSLEEIGGISLPIVSGDKFGYCLETVDDLDSDGHDEILVCSIDYQASGDTGKVELFFGGGSDESWTKMGSPDQMLQGINFGQSISADGDLNGDGLNDLVIGNTGTLQDSSGYSSVEVRYGSNTGFGSSPDHSYQSISSGTLFGYQVQIVNDLNNDGYDELFVSEPYNTSGLFNSGDVWVFYGNPSGVAATPEYRMSGDANDLLGLNFASAGDTNEDGFNDMFITRNGGFDQGKVELVLGSSDLIDGSSYFVAGGSSSFGHAISNHGDSDGDGLSEFFFNSQSVDESQAVFLNLESYSRKLFDVSDVTISGESLDGKIQSSTNGNPRLIFDMYNATEMVVQTQMISLQSDSQSKSWISQDIIAEHSSLGFDTNFELTSSGSPVILYNYDGLKVRTYLGYTGVESEIITTAGDVEYITSTTGLSGESYIAYYSPGTNKLYFSELTETGWSEQTVAIDANISSPISLLVNNSGSPVIIYLDDVNRELNIATFDLSWSVTNITTSGLVNSPSFSSLIDVNDNIVISAMLDDGISNNLSVISINGSIIESTFIAVESDIATNLSLIIDDDNGMILSCLTSSGSLIVYEKANNSEIWTSILLPQPQQVGIANTIQAIGGTVPIIAVNSELDTIYAKISGNWQVIGDSFGSEIEEFTIMSADNQIFVLSSEIETNSIVWSSMEFTQGKNVDESWHKSKIKGILSDNGFDTSIGDGKISFFSKSSSNNFISNIEFYLDSDNDHIFDSIDELNNTPNQWSDQDGDGYGDNIHAPLSDDCPTQSGTSSILIFGCFDADGDGYDDLTDDCNTGFGHSWLGRYGCSDFDQDGWVDWNSLYPFGDIFSSNWKQAFDSDGDSYGDNHGPDCCDTWYDDNAPPGDEFPFDHKQYTDYDGDGYGDNSSDFTGGDACKYDYGTSFIDRLGCQDSDGDGASDPSNLWNESMGADLWPNDSTQWIDSDGDGYGDNSSDGANNPDYFPNNIAAVNDSDGDGYPDNFTEFYDGSNAQGLQIDGCPLVAGNSTNPFYGCLDSDGDNYRDIYTFDLNPTTGLRENQTGDAFPFDPTQWADTDGDGFGDFQGGEFADICPNAPGVINGTLGIGCPLIDGNDDDGDFVINEIDLCPGTQFGLIVDLNGCASNQLDSDSDGVTDDIDICPDTDSLDLADEYGCSQVQREVDDDSDGVYDYLDLCPNTPNGDIPDLDGCSLSQKDSDNDGITDDTDVCPDTPENYPVLADGCTDENAKEIDWDEDGYFGDEDEFMFDPSQWFDTDGDGYGDNAEGVNGDICPLVSGNSTEDRLGCLDTDGDGYSDATLDFPASPSGTADFDPNDATQWRDNDGDGYGDNATGLNPDLCPNTNPLYRTSVDLSGCAANERDTDGDGVVDSLDNCPTTAKGVDGYSDGCPIEKQDETGQSVEILGLSIIWFIGIIVGIVLLFVVIVILRNRGLDDEDWYDEDDDDDDYYEEDRLSFLDIARNRQTSAQPSAPIRQQISGPTGSPTPRGGPTQAPPSRGNPPSSGPPKFNRDRAIPSSSKVSGKKVSKKVKKSSDGEKKVRRAIVEIEEDIFENIPQSSIDEAIVELNDISFDNERQLLMYLQGKGWNAPQSRAIINLAKTRSR